ncbi:MAG TPA: hypothetical protein PKO36_09515 [Candidatus Hydrogenedentes bacterium]|nr:hypothetical protein [Candidatus Hydrogenedentota bacterium]HOV76168.1 hypothetical protein [Candidatus Hydrogenedentota bacterium]HPC18428.1 hypothetical protein [Candidatus Hydrogenedentota bacterium]HRT22168.1 hypothetical protein [Candidatus Hydrogenedentota bacterium]HRT66921.1 hypothetical protein [Candidatus Hydrogenedentota bacterium]
MNRWILSIACILAPAMCLAAGNAEVTIVGRGGSVQEVRRDGTAREISKSNLQFRNRSRETSVKKRVVSAETEKPVEAKPEAKPPEPAAREMSPEEKARAEAVMKSNLEKINKVRQLGGWFYDESNRPLANEELDRRIQEGKLDGIKMVDIYQQQSKTESVENKAGKPSSK